MTCNLSQGIEENTTRKVTNAMIMNAYHEGLSLDKIAKITEKSVEYVKSVIEKKLPSSKKK